MFLGQAVKVPADCDGEANADGTGWIACPNLSMLQWMEGEEDPLVRAARYEEWAVGELLKGRAGARDEVRCRVQGAGARCRRLHVTGAPGGPAVVLTIPMVRGAKTLLVGCVAPGETGAAVPCSLIVELE